LDVSRIISGKLELQLASLDPVKICEAAIDAMQPQIAAKNITIDRVFGNSAGLIPGDAARLQQVMCNLLSNAIKFSADGGFVKVELRRTASSVEIAVTDNGRGIPADFLPRIFDRFSKASRADQGFKGGLGLGLAIARHLVEMHGGTLRAESAGEGQGASFTVALPVESTSQAIGATHEAPPSRRVERIDGVRVLFIDDNPDARDLVATILGERGAKVRTADSTESALAALQRERPDVVISDIEMPGGDGYEMIRALRLRDADTEAPIPAIALTGTTRPEDRIRMLASGFQVHVPKPVDPEELVAAVAAMAAQCRSQRTTARRVRE